MFAFWIILAMVASAASALVMTFVSLAVPVGPWMHVTILLLCMSIARVMGRAYPQALYATSAISISASIATAMGFCFPTWYFLAPDQFMMLLGNPGTFGATCIAGIGLTAGWGYLLAYIQSASIASDDGRSYPVGQLMYTMYQATSDYLQALKVAAGVAVALIYAGIARVWAVSEIYTLGTQRLIAQVPIGSRTLAWYAPKLAVRVSTGAMFVALGYVAGHVLGLPLLAGMGIKWGLLDVLQAGWWPDSKKEDFIFALCSGIVTWSALIAMVHLAQAARQTVAPSWGMASLMRVFHDGMNGLRSMWRLGVLALMLTLVSAWYLALPALLVLYIVVASSVCAWHIALIARKTGLALVGRFATWVMVPGLILWGTDPLHIMLFALGVEVCGMIMVDMLFNQMAAARTGIDRAVMGYWQMLGLGIALVTCAGAFWWLVSTYGVGLDSPLVAQRACSRALLSQVSDFDGIVVIMGMVLAGLMGRLGINSTMALAGILLPVEVSLLLVLGAALRAWSRDPEHWTPFWSGLFAASALGMSVKVFFT